MNMNEEIDVIFDDEDEFGEYTEPQNNGDEGNGEQQSTETPTNEDDLTSEVLRLKGIADPDKIKFEDETGAIVERSWDTLSRAEQLNILAGQENEEPDLADDEIELLNAIRNSGMSVNDYLESLQVPQEAPVQSYKIDQLSDEDVYALDLLEKVGADNITDEELEQAINNAKQNEALFKKTVEGLRKEYIRLQQDEEAQQANELAAQQEAAYRQFATSISNEIRGLNSFAGQELELSDEDSEELAAFMLELDESGTSAFGRALQDPSLFTKAAFWLLNEEQIIEELSRQMQENYKRGYEAGKKDVSGNTKPALVFSPKKTKKDSPSDEFLFDDEEW